MFSLKSGTGNSGREVRQQNSTTEGPTRGRQRQKLPRKDKSCPQTRSVTRVRVRLGTEQSEMVRFKARKSVQKTTLEGQACTQIIW